MNAITVETDIHCHGCVNAIRPGLDNDNKVSEWSVNLDPEVKTLTAQGEGLSEAHLAKLLDEACYKVVGQKTPFWMDMPVWKRASFNTLNCLIGCSIGDFGMVFFLQAFYPETPMIWMMILAIIAGLITSITLETILLKYREHFNWTFALKTAFGMSFISMVAMELAMTGTDFMITGGKAAFNDIWYWLALVPALVVGFITPLPYNYYKLKKYNEACH